MLFAFLVLITRSYLISSNPSSSLSNTCAAVSSTSEDSTFSAQLLSKLSAVAALLALSASSMVTPQQAASAQCLQASLAAMQELNSRSDIPIIRNARSAEESRQFNDKFGRVCDRVQDSEHQKDGSVMRVAVKWAVSSLGEMEWNHNHDDIECFLESVNIMSGSMADFTHDERERKYIWRQIWRVAGRESGVFR